MKLSDSTDKLFAAIAKAQAELGKAKEDGKNPHFRSKYATLESVRDVVVPVFAKHGLSITQHPGLDGECVTMTSVVGHSSGQWMMSTASVPMGRKQDAHAYGSCCTYLRRYAMAAIASAVTGEDDDGNAAVESRSKAPERAKPQRKAKPAPKKKELSALEPEPNAGEHPTWAGNKERFCTDLEAMELELSGVTAWCESKGRGNPATWDNARRAKMIDWLKAGNAEAVIGWVEGGVND